MRLALLLLAVRVLSAQPIPAQAVLKGSPPGGIGAACNSTTGYLTAAGQYVSCVSSVWTVSTGGSSAVHSITIPIVGSPIATGTGNVGLPASANFTCTINKAMITASASGSITVDIWKRNAAIPNSGNKISASAPVTLSSAQVNQNSSLTGWTTSVSANDVFWATVASVDGLLTNVTVQIWCQ